MSRKKIEQDVYFKSFRYTDKQLYLNEFLNELENKNRFIVTLILGSKWNDPTILDTLETVNLVDNDQIKYQEEKVIPWQINYTQTSSNKRLSTKLSKMVIPLKILHKDWECILIRSKHG